MKPAVRVLAEIPPERQAAIFDAFQQAENTTERGFGGTGRGLTIFRALLAAMHYRLTLGSRPGEGSDLTVQFEE